MPGAMPISSPVSVTVYDSGGRLARRILEAATLLPGRYRERWDGRDEVDRRVATGVYFFQVEMESQRHAGHATLMR